MQNLVTGPGPGTRPAVGGGVGGAVLVQHGAGLRPEHGRHIHLQMKRVAGIKLDKKRGNITCVRCKEWRN